MRTLIAWILLSMIHLAHAQNGDSSSFKLSDFTYHKTPIAKQIKKHPEHFSYLEDVKIERLTYKSDGHLIAGYVVQPKKEGKYPCVVYNRGGNRDYGQLLVGHAVGLLAEIANGGYVVFASNYRGVDGGDDEFGGKDVNDVVELIQLMHHIPKADTSKVTLIGVSRGGMMNYLTLKRNLKNIKASIQIGGITDLDTTIKYHPEIGEVCEELIPNYNSNSKNQLRERSAIHWVGQLPKIPQMIIHGTADQSVSYEQIPPFLDSLKKYEIPYEAMIYEKDNHGIRHHQQEMREEIKRFLEEYLSND